MIDTKLLALLVLCYEDIFNYKARHGQLISIIMMLSAYDKGRLLQIRTGEGKSTIIAIVAAYKVLKGHHVDIITSS